MAEIKNSESDMSTQQKAEQDWFNIAAVSWDSKAFLKDIHLTNYRFTFSYDGTLCYSKWPELDQPNLALIEYLQEWKRNGNKLILWTCRAGEALSKAVEWYREQNLEFDAVNDNLPEIIEFYGHNSRKISCDYYIDDRMLLPENAKA